jgi:hypothetical protein
MKKEVTLQDIKKLKKDKLKQVNTNEIVKK